MDYLDDLGPNVPVSALLRMHGHSGLSCSDDSDLDSDTDSDDFWDEYWDEEPEKLQDAKYYPLQGWDINKILEDSSKVKMVQDIAVELSKKITDKYCNICQKKADGHYKAAPHRRTVKAWIQHRINKLGQIPTSVIYCEACNLSLTQTAQVNKHYCSGGHKKNVDLYCMYCQRNLSDATAMARHLKSRQHHRHLNTNARKFSVEAISNQNEGRTNITEINSSATVAQKDYNLGDASKSDHRTIAVELECTMTRDYCSICKRTASLKPDHYKTKKHITKVIIWIKDNSKKHNFNMQYIAALYCDACNVVFKNGAIATLHYSSDEHKKKTINYCKPCLKHVRDINEHMLTNSHTRELPSPGIQVNNVTYIAQKLKTLLEPSYCGICCQDVDIRQYNYHYLQTEHTLTVRKWLAKYLPGQQVNAESKLLYCEACSTYLSGTTKAWDHYQNATHLYNEKTYCAICVYRGTPDEIIKHNLKKHSDLCSSPSLPKDLINLITLSECKLCFVKLNDADEANDHYQTTRHSCNMKKYFDNYGLEDKDKELETSDVSLSEIKQNQEDSVESHIIPELKTFLNKIYFSKIMPLEKSLDYLKSINSDFEQLGSKGLLTDENDCLKTSSNVSSAPSTSTQSHTHTQDYAKMKLELEFLRLNMVLKNNYKVPMELVWQYVSRTNKMLDYLMKNTNLTDIHIDDLFDRENETISLDEDEFKTVLREELENMEKNISVIASKKDNGARIDIALDCITNVNVRLESLVEKEDDNDYY